MGGGVGNHPVGALKQALLPGKEVARARTPGLQFPALVDLFVIGGNERIKNQGNALTLCPAARRLQVALPEAGHPDQIGSGHSMQPRFPVGQPGKLRMEIPELPPEIGEQFAQDAVAGVSGVEASPP